MELGQSQSKNESFGGTKGWRSSKHLKPFLKGHNMAHSLLNKYLLSSIYAGTLVDVEDSCGQTYAMSSAEEEKGSPGDTLVEINIWTEIWRKWSI